MMEWRSLALVASALALAHSGSVPAAPRRSSPGGASERRAVDARSRLLLVRGGDASAEEGPADDDSAPIRQTRLKIAAGSSGDPSLAEMSKADAAAMGLEAGGAVTQRGRKQRRTTCVIVEDDSLPAGEVRLSDAALANVRLAEGDDVIVAPEALQPAERVLLLPFASDLDGFDGSADEAFDQGLGPYLKDNDRPLTVGDIVVTTAGDATIRWKVLELEPEAANPLEAARGTVTAETTIFTEGEPLGDGEADTDDVVGYDDIGGLEKQMSMLRELVDLPLRHPAVFDEIGVRPPRGVLLTGPPGSGKTMVANAVKSESGVYFTTVNGPEVMSKRSGESEAGLRKTFEDAEANSPAIIFIDEIDAIAPKREKAQGEVERRIVSQLLTLMDGLKPSSHVVVMAATNRPSVLDTALRRFGRFDREIDLGIPDEAGRHSILMRKASNMRMSAEVDLAKIAEDTHGYCGADLAQLVTEAAMQCVRERAGEIDVDAEDVEPGVLESFVVQPRHLTGAMEKTAPSSLRDKAVEIPDCSWEDVGGLLDVKREMTETLMYPLKYAAKYSRYGMAPTKGMLLYGPSGCGKTLVAKAIANEVKSNFLSVKGPELLSMWFGESESNVRQLFDKARGAAPCILFFDEIDSIAKPRGSGGAGGGEAGDRIVNQILTEIDGVGAKKSVFVIAATNRPDMLDSAIMRPGRLDQLVYLPLPDLESRKAIFKACTRKSPLAADISLDELAERTDGFSGADITEVCQRACKLAIRQHIADANAGAPEEDRCTTITLAFFEEAFEKARKSVSAADVKKFERFQASMKAR